MASTLKIDVLSSHAGLFKELNIVDLLGTDQDRLLQMEVNNHYDFLRSARLEEAVLDVRETHINFLAFTCYKTKTILLDFKVTDSFFASKVRSNN